jgi:hypothetical protein
MMRCRGIMALVTLLVVSLTAAVAYAGGAARASDAIWAHDEPYDTVITSTSFMAPPAHSTDIIYSFIMSGLMGQRSVANSAPRVILLSAGQFFITSEVFSMNRSKASKGIPAMDKETPAVVKTATFAVG